MNPNSKDLITIQITKEVYDWIISKGRTCKKETVLEILEWEKGFEYTTRYMYPTPWESVAWFAQNFWWDFKKAFIQVSVILFRKRK